ncbi:MAG: hypothetical protein AAFV53_06635, partial [Myxococcota bacterium]
VGDADELHHSGLMQQADGFDAEAVGGERRQQIGEEMGAVIDALDWAQTITDLLPSFTTDGFGIEAVGLLHEPTVVQLVGVPDAIDARVSLRDVGLEYSMWVDVLGNRIEAPISLFFGEIAIDALVVPSLTPEKTLSLELTEPEVIMDDPDITILVLEGPLLEWVLENIATWIIEPLGEVLLDLVLAEYGVIELPEPLSFETELLGMPLSIELSEIGGDVEGVRAGLGVGIDEPVSSVFTVPVPHDETTGTQVAMGVHEGLLDTMLNEDLLSQLDSFLAEEPAIGALLGGGITQLPGGDDAPEGAAWCVSMNPGTATVVRMQASIDPLAVLYAPDFVFTFGTLNNGVCEDWLVASLATEVGVGLDGTELTIDIQAPEGVILYYGADDYDEQEVVVALGDYVSNLVNLAGSFIDLDLGSLLGDLTLIEGMTPLSPTVTSSEPLYNDDGSWTEGMYRVELQLWAD